VQPAGVGVKVAVGCGVDVGLGLAVGVAGTSAGPQPAKHTKIKSKMMEGVRLFNVWIIYGKIEPGRTIDGATSSLTHSLKTDYTLPAGV
jgi:hypothetical protein